MFMGVITACGEPVILNNMTQDEKWNIYGSWFMITYGS